MIRISLVIILLLFCLLPLESQFKSTGISANFVLTNNNADINQMLGFEDDFLTFSPKTSINYDINIYSECKISDNIFLGFELGYLSTVLDNQADESTIFIIDKLPVDGLIKHQVETNLHFLYPGINFGYSFNGINLSIGSKFPYTLKADYKHSQEIISPENVEFINPNADESKDIGNTNYPIVQPFIRLEVIPGFKKFKTSDIYTSLVFEYSFLINSVSSDYQLGFGNLSLGLSVGFDWFNSDRPDMIQWDTVYHRDTLITESDLTIEPTITLISSNSNVDVIDGEFSLNILNIYETYQLTLPGTAPLLNGELTPVFLTNDSVESKSCNISYKKQILSKVFIDIENRKWKTTDTLKILHIPVLRFYYEIISEAGLHSAVVVISDSDAELIKHNVDENSGPFFDIDLRDYVKATKNILMYQMILVDFEGQKKEVSNGQINISFSDDTDMDNNEILFMNPELGFEEIEKEIRKFNIQGDELSMYYDISYNRPKQNIIQMLSKSDIFSEKHAISTNEFLEKFKLDNKKYINWIVIERK